MNYTSFLYKVYIKAAQIHNFCCQSNCCTHLSSWARKNQPEFPTSTKQPEENIVSFVIFPVNNVCSVLCCVELSTGLREILKCPAEDLGPSSCRKCLLSIVSLNSFLILEVLVTEHPTRRRPIEGNSCWHCEISRSPVHSSSAGASDQEVHKEYKHGRSCVLEPGHGQSQPKYLPNKSPFCDS